jgi:hypothetical protein
MPTFAELRAKAEAAANSAKESANSKISDYRGDKKPEKPVYKPPPRRPAVKPPLPPDSSRPRPQNVAPIEEVIEHEGYEVEDTHEDEDDLYAQQSPRASIARTSIASRDSQKNDAGIQVLLKDKDLFFQFMDEVSINN